MVNDSTYETNGNNKSLVIRNDLDEIRKCSQDEVDKVRQINEENQPLIGENQKKIAIVTTTCAPKNTTITSNSNSNASSDNNISIRSNIGRMEEYNKFQNTNLVTLRAHPSRHGMDVDLRTIALRSKHQLPLTMTSLRSLKSVMMEDPNQQNNIQVLNQAQANWRESLYYSDNVSVRSLASVGMGSTDGKKVTITRMPTSPSELFNIANPHAQCDDGLSSMASSSYFDPLEEHTNFRLPRRQHWANKMQFVLACVGYSVGLGNVWRFPYLCYKSGGGVFLVPYFLILIVCGIPLLYMELAVGQFTKRGPIGALGKMCPLFKGAGLASVVISFIMSTYYNVIIAYTLYYFFTAFKSDVPWDGCNNRWNTEQCWDPLTMHNTTKPNNTRTPSGEFFDMKVLDISAGIEHPGEVRWELAACLIVAWLLVYFSIWKSVKSSGKVLYFTATFPYLLILVFLVRALTLDGADLGLRYFFKPRWELLADAKVWVNAAAQNFNSIGIAYGSVISFASYNKFHNPILPDTLSVTFINAVTSILVGICTFATIGNIAKEQGTSIEDVITDGPGLVFVVYPQAMAKMPAAQMWGVLFFFMLLCLGLNSQFAIVEVVVTSIQDGFPNWIKKYLVCHEVLVLVVVIISFLFGLPHITQGGMYFFQLVDHYAASLSIMYLAFFEVIAISWIYGAHRLAKNVQEMTGKYPSLYFTFCWWIASPVLIMALWVFSIIDYEPPTYDNGSYTYPAWAEALGWGIASLSLACIPLMAVIVIFRADGASLQEKFSNSVKSQIYVCEQCGDQKCTHDEASKEELREMTTLLTQKFELQLTDQINLPS